MAGFFKSPVFVDDVLGRLERARGLWRGALELDAGQQTPLALFGSNREPDADALAEARLIAPSFSAWRPSIQLAVNGGVKSGQWAEQNQATYVAPMGPAGRA